jgi:hypothetical protein
MKHQRQLLGAMALFVVLITGCKKEASIDPEQSLDVIKNSAKSSANSSPQLNAKLDLLLASMPAGYEERLKENERHFLKQHPEYRAFVRNALVPTPCDANTSLNQWLDNELADWNSTVFFYAIVTGMIDFPTYDALLFENSAAGQYFGVEGEHSQRLIKSIKDLRRFWNIQSDGIVMAAMHGNMLRDREKIIRIDMILYGDSRPVAEYWADLILTLLDVFPQYRNGNHPIFTFNAFALETFYFPPYGIVPDKIVMGDGIMEAYTGIGFDDVAPQAILAHEFGHHIQIQLDLFTDEESPEATRRTELMADAYSAYYLSHSRGAAMQWKRVKQFLEVFYNIGDCAFNNNGHHGTPTQRMAAAEWGYSVANDAQKQGHILTSQEFASLFDAQLPILVNY